MAVYFEILYHCCFHKSSTIPCQSKVTYPILQYREAFEGGDNQGEEAVPFCAIERLDGMHFSFRADICLSVSLHGPFINPLALQFWPIVGWINHQYMPLQFRVIFHSFIACCW
jgi:hypothetical protein